MTEAGSKFKLREYFQEAFRWRVGRQKSGYDKMLIVKGAWPMPFDVYLLRFPEGSEIKPHTDPVSFGNHYRLNIILKQAKIGGEFKCADPLFETERIKLFRPDASLHSVSSIERGIRYVFSIGWVIQPRT